MTLAGKKFYNQPTIDAAKALLGCILKIEINGQEASGLIVETEAYLSADEASHSFKGQTLRNQTMFGPPATAYIYKIYGIHHCFNVVTSPQGVGEAVLIRAIKPLTGVSTMLKNRQLKTIHPTITNGPAKLVQALGITPSMNGTSLITGPIKIYLPKTRSPLQIKQTTRIGIKKNAHALLRFYLYPNPYISKP